MKIKYKEFSNMSYNTKIHCGDIFEICNKAIKCVIRKHLKRSIDAHKNFL